MGLSDYTVDQLLTEMVKRRNNDESLPIVKWCENCTNFKFRSKNDTDDYNPCVKGHQMLFRMPEHPHDEISGFYLRVCPDWTVRPPA